MSGIKNLKEISGVTCREESLKIIISEKKKKKARCVDRNLEYVNIHT